MSKRRRLTAVEKSEIRDDRRKAEEAAYPGYSFIVTVEDLTDEDGNAVVTVIATRRQWQRNPEGLHAVGCPPLAAGGTWLIARPSRCESTIVVAYPFGSAPAVAALPLGSMGTAASRRRV